MGSWMLAGSFEEKPLHAVYVTRGCDKDEANKNEKATIVSHSNFNTERDGIELAWNPPRRCTKGQIENKETMKCRTKEDLFFFTYTMGNKDTGSFGLDKIRLHFMLILSIKSSRYLL